MNLISWFFTRLTEASTYAGLGLIINGITGPFVNGVPQTGAGWIQLFGQVVAGVIASVHKEAAPPAPPAPPAA